MIGIGLLELLALLVTAASSGGLLGLPVSVPPLPPDPVIERAAPDECLLHIATAGMAAPDANSANLTERMLADDEMREFLAAVAKEAVSAGRESMHMPPPVEDAAVTFVTALLTKPVAFSVERLTPPGPGQPLDTAASLLLRTGEDDADIATALDRLMRTVTDVPDVFPVVDVTLEGTTFRRFPTPGGPLSWGTHDGSLVVAFGEQALESLVARISDAGRKTPSWKADVEKRSPMARRSTLAYADMAAMLTIAMSQPVGDHDRIQAFLDASGAGRIRALTAVSGMDAEGTVSDVRLGFDGPPRGIFAAPEKGIEPGHLARVPADAIVTQAWSLDLSRTLATGLDVAAATDPAAAAELRRGLEQFRAVAGFDLDRHLLETLGPDWTVCSLPAAGGLLPNVAVIAGIRDRETFAKTHKALLGVLRNVTAKGPTRTTITEMPYRGHTLHCLSIETPDMAVPVTPTWCLADDRLVVTLSPQMMKTLLARTADDAGVDTVAEVKAALAGGGADLVGVLDPQLLLGTLCGFYEMATPVIQQATAKSGQQVTLPTLPRATAITPFVRPGVTVVRHEPDGIRVRTTTTLPLGPLTGGGGAMLGASPAATPVLVGLLLPAVQAAREAARRTQGMNNLKQVILAMHIHADAMRSLPHQAICDAAGKPLLSWRVAILPFIEQKDLYDEFHLDEPWDSEHNRPLLARMPSVYADVAADPADLRAGRTTLQVFTGEGTPFPEPGDAVNFRDILDGTSKTLAIVEVSPDRAVPWTKPEDHPFDPGRPLDGIGNPRRPGGLFLGAFFDGSVQALMPDVDPDTFRALVTPAGFEPVTRP